MPSQPNNLHPANDPSHEEPSDNQAEMILVPAEHQRFTESDSNSSDDSDSDDSKLSEPLLDLNDINKMNINTLRNIITQSTLCK
ncbi:hypothetical protein NDA11_003960 [Ustilago hordei]|uniref:Uncharacterized protein n=1 Tax=Ustilago hordei TaxID=120017 RepID=I2FRE5_USTHO|nr:uncharacterized protein UHO2_05639 [Ustilago hordei]KAJ1042774.1 hypothetical protein NDA10_002050 [Ustilago hordei]KAJ1572851.1 hypothetical protein NDA15_006201 [Ustilago hordei]KAJ1575234.1 hypothetical protein NDA11_003960 [Ustilago hordei]KAJ1575824.1 hypothetical protein NDA12_006824 [Ustilago hordei]KAJ1598066.1 hypothetical protein NDA14_003473 [Ustilago hordei]